jgi:serine O-acetyltransferase
MPLLELLKEDLATHRGFWFSPGFQALALQRIGVRSRRARFPIRPVARRLYKAGYIFVRNVYGIELPVTTTVGRRVEFAHQSGIVIHTNAVIGDDCVIRQNVTLGAAVGDARYANQAPRLGRGVSVGAGAAVVGNVRIGDRAMLGPNVTVFTNVPEDARVLAPSPRMMKVPQAVVDREEQLRDRS